ncbi:uncharacterized protein MELLADRAFT_107407 [Melampsora larici-populina 98AG31]|uniref:Uncharacterized protein n=1 Tax=Melampsora larici-populina (strain 98AG31 / pathotype 3-4-7) TaxID=747676 RepID=F4RPP7_MELLP|nr:uncharacterized protein MELLADRAFT_107407 [Melampsora larici-populina 98AG31]EGG05695.1 hypothetical protein MELLADRAFT_107407 [Melampsora larici-populina 98AG31]
MPPRSTYRLAVCRCITHCCGQQLYIDANGEDQNGNCVSVATMKAHQLADQFRHLSVHAPQDLFPTPRPHIPTNSQSSSSQDSQPGTPTHSSSSRSSHEARHASPEAGGSNDPPRAHGTESQNQASFDTTLYMSHKVYGIDPVQLYPLLFAASLAVFANLSSLNLNWVLRSQRDYIQLVKEAGSTSTEARTKLLYTQQRELEELPVDISTVFVALNLNPCLAVLNTCPSCFALYRIGHTPELCNFPVNTVPGLFESAFLPPSLEIPDVHVVQEGAVTCSRPLFKDRRPIRQTGFQDLEAWLARPSERQKIFENHGVRYSVLLELDYWNLIDFQVVDSMHNLLLGLLNWHCRRFWAMQDDEEDEPEPRPATVPEIQDLLNDMASEHSEEPFDSVPGDLPTSASGVHFNDLACSTDNSSTDPDFENTGWNEWCLLSKEASARYSPFITLARHVPRITRDGIIFSTKSDNPNNSVVITKSLRGGIITFGQIDLKSVNARRLLGIRGCVVRDVLGLKATDILYYMAEYKDEMKYKTSQYREKAGLYRFQHCDKTNITPSF